jgi:hypothetical protein
MHEMSDAATAVERRGLNELIDAVWTARVPTSPPPSNRDDEARGLALLDLSLRLDHISRITENLRLIDRGHLRRTVSLDVDLSTLTTKQQLTLSSSHDQDGQPQTVWVPVSPHSRRDLSPVVVRDSSGKVIPRQTTQETARLLTAGLSRLFRMLLEVDNDAALDLLRKGQPRGRWLVQAALATLVDAGTATHLRLVRDASGDTLRRPLSRRAAKDGAVTNRDYDSYTIRHRAETALRGLRGHTATAFERLVEIASREFLLVVSLPLDRPQSYLTYDAPLIPGIRQPSPRRNFVNSWLPVNREFTVQYTTSIPRTVRSYHVTFEVPEEIHVRRFLLSTDVDEPFVQSLVDDIEAVAMRYQSMAQQNPPKLLELELQSIGSRLAELGHRRMLNVVQYRKYLADCFEIFGQRPPDTEQPVLDEAEAVRRLVDGEETVSSMAAFAGHYHADRFRQLASGPLTTHPLRRVANHLRNARLGHDVTVDNDPREHGAHAHWRTAAPPTPRSNEPIRATAYLALADEPPALIESVFRMVLGLLVVVLGLGVLNGIDQELDLSRADAIVAVLLLVPGILLTRLDIPNTNTVLGQLRVFQRR